MSKSHTQAGSRLQDAARDVCSKCGASLGGQPRYKKPHSRCQPCRNQSTRAYRERVKAAGGKVVYHANKEKRAAYNAEYHKRDDVLNRKAAAWHVRKKIPAEAVRIAARQALKLAVRRGDVLKQPCVQCGEVKTHGHHPDYSKPLSVVWLCRKHHEEIHHAN